MGRVRKGDVGVGCFIAFWALCVLVNLAFWGVIIWGIVKLVQHFT